MTTRRGAGEGTIREVPGRDLFQGRYRAQGERRSVYGHTRAQVRAKLRELARQAELGLSLEGGRQTTAAYLDRWLDSVARHRVRSTTFARYSQLVRIHALPTIGAIPIAKLAGQHLAALYSDRLEARQSARSVEQLHSVLHSAFRQAVRWDLIARNPADLVSPSPPEASRDQGPD